jgi:hypothetical protein
MINILQKISNWFDNNYNENIQKEIENIPESKLSIKKSETRNQIKNFKTNRKGRKFNAEKKWKKTFQILKPYQML